MFNVGLIDSLKVRVKLEKVKIIDKRLITDFIAYYPDIETLDNDGNEQQILGDNFRKAEPFTKIINGITYRFYIKAFIDSKKQAHEYVVFQISAKMLKEKYFEGISAFNYRTIIDDINSFGVLHIKREDFCEGLVSDIDICINQLIDLKSLKTAFSLIINNPNKGKAPLLHYINKSSNLIYHTPAEDLESEKESTREDEILKNLLSVKKDVATTTNLGLDFNKREKATNTAPYCKIYHKGFELLSKSIAFYKAYLEPMKTSVIDNLVRYEFTIKAHKHKEYLCKQGYKADFKTFYDLLKARQEDLTKIAKSGLPHYIEEKVNSKVNAELSPIDVAMQYYIENLIKLGFDKEKLLGFTYLIDCPVSRSRTKSKAKKLIDDLTNRDKNLTIKIQNNERSNKFLQNLGVNL